MRTRLNFCGTRLDPLRTRLSFRGTRLDPPWTRLSFCGTRLDPPRTRLSSCGTRLGPFQAHVNDVMCPRAGDTRAQEHEHTQGACRRAYVLMSSPATQTITHVSKRRSARVIPFSKKPCQEAQRARQVQLELGWPARFQLVLDAALGQNSLFAVCNRMLDLSFFEAAMALACWCPA